MTETFTQTDNHNKHLTRWFSYCGLTPTDNNLNTLASFLDTDESSAEIQTLLHLFQDFPEVFCRLEEEKRQRTKDRLESRIRNRSRYTPSVEQVLSHEFQS